MSQTYQPPPTRTKVPATAGISAAALAAMVLFTAAHEGEVRHTYVDKLGKGQPLSYCYGETAGATADRHYTHAECLAQLRASALAHWQEIAHCLPDGLPDPVKEAFGDAGYNLGAATFCKSSMSRKALAGDLPAACDALSLYVYSNGKDCRLAGSGCPGIVRRRQDERALCLKGLAAPDSRPREPAPPAVPTPITTKEHTSWTTSLSSFWHWVRSRF